MAAPGSQVQAPPLWQRLLGSRLLKAVSGQALVSAFHFALNLLLLPLLAPHDYGVFALSFVLALFAAAINNALIATPLSIYTPIIQSAPERRAREALFNALNGVFVAAVLALGLAAALGERALALPVALFVASYATRQYSRSFAYARLRAEVPARADTLYVLVAALGSAGSVLAFGPGAVAPVLLSLALGNALASAYELSQLPGAWRLPAGPRALAAYAELWPQTRWALLGAATTLLMAQAHSLLVSGVLGPAAFAPLAAGGVLFGPVRVALTTWQNLSKPQLAIDLDQGRTGAVARSIRHTTALMCAALAVVALGLWLCWEPVYQLLYAHKYSDAPMGAIVALWTLITLFVALNSPASAALQALADFKLLAIASVVGALLSTATVGLLLWRGDASSTLYGALVAEVFMAAYLLLQLRARLGARA